MIEEKPHRPQFSLRWLLGGTAFCAVLISLVISCARDAQLNTNLDNIQDGMSREQVRALCGEPDEIDTHGAWIYHTGWPLPLWNFGVTFTPEGKVDSTWT